MTVGKNEETGKPIFKFVYGATMREVRAKMKEVTDNPKEIVTPNGKYVKVEEPSPDEKQILFGDWLDTWLPEYKTNSVALSTYESYRGAIKNHIKPALGKVPIDKITSDQIQALLNKTIEEGARKDGKAGSLKGTTVKKIKIVINNSLKQAVRNKYIPYNPTEAVIPPKIIPPEIRVLTCEEQETLMKGFRGHRLESLFKLALATGMRKGELLALTWKDVDFDNKTISVSKSATRVRNQKTMKTFIQVKEPKSRSGYRTIPMLPSVVPILEGNYILQQRERKEAGSAYNKAELVFCTSIGTMIEPRRINTVLNRVLKNANIKHIKFHGLRHTFATRALETGIPLKVVSDILGHSGAQLTLNLYMHVLQSTAHDQLNKMEKMFLEMETGQKQKKDDNEKVDISDGKSSREPER